MSGGIVERSPVDLAGPDLVGVVQAKVVLRASSSAKGLVGARLLLLDHVSHGQLLAYELLALWESHRIHVAIGEVSHLRAVLILHKWIL